MARKPARKTRRTTPKAPQPAPLWHSWRHIAAYIYLFICFFDFVGMPVYYEFAHKPLSKIQLVELVRNLDAANQVQAMQIISTEQRWEPLTLGETGLFHVAFGAILGVAAFTRGRSRDRSGRRGYFDGANDGDFDSFEDDDYGDGGYGRGNRGGYGGGYGGGNYGGAAQPDQGEPSSTATADGLDPFADPPKETV